MGHAVLRDVTKGINWFFDYNMNGATADYQDRFGQIGDIPVMWNE